MQKKTLRRIAVTGLAVPALAFGVPAVAMADTGYNHSSQSAGPNGASSHSQSARTNGNGGGGSSYEESHSHAGPNGAGESNTSSNAGGHGGLLGGLLG